MADIDYVNKYNKTFLDRSDGAQNLNCGQLKFGDALASIAYAHDITYEQIIERFPQVRSNERHAGGYTVDCQLEFIKSNAKRTPKNILEIGAGRGEVTLFLTAMGYDVTAIEPSVDFVNLITETSHKLFPTTAVGSYTYINKPIHLADIDYSKFDTILMVESLEHILAEHFDPEWEKIKANFKGYFIVVNWKKYHPIAVGQYADASVHCRLVNDALYDSYCEGHITKVRDKSHLCIEI
jgi:SAM-dependent methyltransferase